MANAKRLSEKQMLTLTIVGNLADAMRSEYPDEWMQASVTDLTLLEYFNFLYFSEAAAIFRGLERRGLLRERRLGFWCLTRGGYDAYTAVAPKAVEAEKARVARSRGSAYAKLKSPPATGHVFHTCGMADFDAESGDRCTACDVNAQDNGFEVKS